MTGSTRKPGQSGLPTANPTKAFWHSEPSKILLGHKTTPTLPTEADIVIIGSGITGASAANFIRQDEKGKDLKVVMLEAREACWGATGRNGGHCQPGIYDRPPALSSFEIRNYLALQALVSENAIDCDWVDQSVVHAYMSAKTFNAAVATYETHKTLDPEISKLVTIVAQTSSTPSLSDLRVSKADGAIMQKHASSVWPYKLISWMLENLLAQNTSVDKPEFNLQTNTPVLSIQKCERENEDGSWIVHTPRGMISTKQVLLATNAYTSFLLPEMTGIITPVRGEMSALFPPDGMKGGYGGNLRLGYTYGFMGNGKQEGHQDDYLIQQPYSSSSSTSSTSSSPAEPDTGGLLLFGGGRSCAALHGEGVYDDSSIDLPVASYLRQEISLMLDLHNNEEELKAKYEWSGIMGFSVDDHPWVGEVSEGLVLGGGKGLWVCGAYTGHGMPNAHLCAKGVVGMMLGWEEGRVDLPDVFRVTGERVERARRTVEKVRDGVKEVEG